jgi:hypothetical protein
MHRWLLVLLMLPTLLFSADFWKEKKADEWSDKDVKRLLSNSPWAKQVSADSGADRMMSQRPGAPGGQVERGPVGPGTSGPVTSGPGPGPGDPTTGVPRGGVGAGTPDSTIGPAFNAPKVTVRWESAQPLREVASRDQSTPRPKNLEELSREFYVITALNLPIISRTEQSQNIPVDQIQARLQQVTSLQRKGKEPIAPARVEVLPATEGPMVVFLFPRSENIAQEDKEVTLESAPGPYEVKTKFKLKDMVYQDQLAL